MTHAILEEAAWIPHYNLTQIYQQETIVVNSIDDSIKNLHTKWLHHIGDNPQMRLDRFLMRRSDVKTGLLECNMDPFVLDLFRECFYWIGLRFNIPVHIQVIYDKWNTLHFVYESVLAVTLAYNKILEGPRTATTRRVDHRRIVARSLRNRTMGIAVLSRLLSPPSMRSRGLIKRLQDDAV